MSDSEIDEELLKLLKQARSKPRNFALVAKGTNCLKLIVSRRPIRDNLVVQAKKESGGNKAYRGICVGAGGMDMVFQVADEEEPSIPLPKFKRFIADRTGLALKPRFETKADTAEIDDDPDGDD